MNVLDALFGPVSKTYCSFFYYYSIICFIFYMMAVIGMITYGIKHSKGASYYAFSIVASSIYLIGYFQNRLLFSMCTR